MKIPKTVLFVSASLLLGCATGEYRANAKLLAPWSSEAQSEVPDPPYVARYEHAGKSLSYIASRHEHRPGNAVFQMVEREFETLDPQVVIIEGLNRAAGFSPEFYQDWVAAMPANGIWEAGEAGYTASLAMARGIPFVGGEPTPLEIQEGMKDSPYDLRDLIYYSALRQIPQWRRTGRDPERSFGQLYAGFIEQQSRAYRFDPGWLSSREEFIAWYEDRNDRTFDIAAITVMDAAPISGPGALFTNRISVREDLVRNARISQVIAEMLNQFDRVLVVYGAGHHVQQARVLERMLGDPSFHPLSGQAPRRNRQLPTAPGPGGSPDR